MDSIICNYPEYPEDETGVPPSYRPHKASLIVEKTSTKVLIKYANFADIFSFTLGSTNMLSNWLMTKSWTDPFGYVSIIETLTIFPVMSVSIARVVTIARTVLMAMIGLIPQDKLGKV